jgi:succinoglycan biosynthesis transport protein ExoP
MNLRLQTIENSQSVANGDRTPQFATSAELLGSCVGFIRRQYGVILFVLSLCIALAAVYVYTAPPRYSALAKMIIDSRRVQLFQQQAVVGDVATDAAQIESQVEIMKSENVALSVIKGLHLTEDLEFAGGSSGLIGAMFDLIRGWFVSPGPPSEFELTRRALDTVASDLSVKRVGLTYIMDISFQSLVPDRAAQIANRFADAYIADQLEAKYQTSRGAAGWLQERLKELRGQASVAERAVLDYKVKNKIVDSGGRLMNEQQLAELNSSVVQTRAQTAEAKARLDRVQQILNSDDPDFAASDTATVTESLHNDVITKLRQTYLDYRVKEAEWSRRYGASHLAAVNMRNQMREIRRSIVDELRRIAETYKSEYVIAKAREDSVDKSLSAIVSESQSTNQAQIELRELESASQTYRALYDNFLQRYMESVQQQSFPITEARVITQATRPLFKSSPKSLLVLGVALTGGLIFGVGTGILREMSDRKFRTSDQVETFLRSDCLAVLPALKSKPLHAKTMAKAEPESGSRTIIPDGSIMWQVVDAPFSRFSEEVRNIKVAIDLASVRKSTRVVGVTSALPNEGKSTIATAIALLMASSGARVLLVDCDLRNPSLSRKFASHAKTGILDVINGNVSVEDAVRREPSTGLTVLPAGMKTRVAHTGAILASGAMQRLFEQLRSDYDYIIVDLSPLAPIADVRATLNLIDCYLFVIEWGRTKIDVVEHVLAAAREIRDNLVGAVLNKVDIGTLQRYESYRGHYYYNQDYSRYGYTE